VHPSAGTAPRYARQDGERLDLDTAFERGDGVPSRIEWIHRKGLGMSTHASERV
jgi:hypothetical protein